MNMNVWFGIGRLATEPYLKEYERKVGENAGTTSWRCFYRVAITRNMDRGRPRAEQRTSFIPIVAWGEAAKRHATYLAKGTEVAMLGELVVDSNRQADGTYRERWNVTVRDVQYGQASMKNMSADQLGRRIGSLQEAQLNLQKLAALTNAAGAAPAAATEAPTSAPAIPLGEDFAEPAESAGAAVPTVE